MVRLGILMSVALTAVGCISIAPRSQPASQEAIVLTEVPVRAFGVERCGAGSLSAVLASYGKQVSIEALDASLPKAKNGGVLSVDLLLAARGFGFSSALISANEDLIAESLLEGRPVILMLRVVNAPGVKGDLFHYVVVDGLDPQRDLYRVQFGDGKARWIPLDKMRRAWADTGNATLLIYPADQVPIATEYRYAVALEEAGKLEEAASVYADVLRRHPESVLGWTNLGNVHAARGLSQSAEQAYREALRLDPVNTDVLNNFAWLLLVRGESLAEAEQLARRSLDAEGIDSFLTLDTLSRIVLEQGRCEEAIEFSQQSIASAPEGFPQVSWLWQGLGEAQMRCGQEEEARISFETALIQAEDRVLARQLGTILGELAENRP